MNRRQKIIVSVTGIFIVLLILIGLTYAYFLTRITGNSNSTSISVSTANLELVYGDGTTALLTSSTPIEPGKFSSSKDFTVTNNGNALTDYAVTLEDFSITYAADTVIDGISVKAGTVTKMEYPSDMKMEITCIIESDEASRNGKSCGNVDGTLPTENSILLTNSIEVDDIHKYVLTLTYEDSGTDQSLDMNKTIKGKIDIIDPKSTIDLEGTVASYQSGDYVEINSTPIKSEIVDGKYSIIGVEPGNHTLYVKYKDVNGVVQTRGSQSLTIKKGDEVSVSGNTITFTDASRSATVDVTESYGITVDATVKSSLRDAIIANAMSGKNGTTFSNTPLSNIGGRSTSLTINTGKYKTITATEEDGFFGWAGLTYGETQDSADGDWNEITGSDDVEKCESVKNKYISSLNKCNLIDCTNQIGKILSGKVVDCESDGTPILEQEIIEYESILSVTEDDYGKNYYYRGRVEDNYVNFAGMCWRIVNVAGDGSIKLILDDYYADCDNDNYTGNWMALRGNYGYERKNVNNYYGYQDIMNYLNPKTDAENSMVKAFYDLQTIGKLKDYTSNLKAGDWCLEDEVYIREGQSPNFTYTKLEEINYDKYMYYESSLRMSGRNGKTPTLKCTGNNIKEFNDVIIDGETITKKSPMYVSTLTIDEFAFAGGGYTGNLNFYLINDYLLTNIKSSDAYWYLLSAAEYSSPSDWIYEMYIYDGETSQYDGIFGMTVGEIGLEGYTCGDMCGTVFRPSVSLKTGTMINIGDGTRNNPYIVE